MTINVNHIVRVSNARYTSLTKRFTGEKGLQEALDYETFVFNALLRYAETGDPTHLNRPVEAARNMNRVRLTTRLLKGYSAHEWDGRAFGGKAKDRKLKMLRRMSEDEIALDVATKLEAEADASKKAESEFDVDALIARVAKQIASHDVNVIDFEARLSAKVAELKAKAA